MAAYTLAAWSPYQTFSFLKRWFGNEDNEQRKRTLLYGSDSITSPVWNPYSLTILCWLSQRVVLSLTQKFRMAQ